MATVTFDSTVNSAFQMDISMQALLVVIADLSDSAAAPDAIATIVYKRCISLLAKPLLSIFKQSMYQGISPQKLGSWLK
jgi:hypothetical protein